MLKEQIQQDMKDAMRANDPLRKRLGAIRLLLAAIKQREVDERIVLDDTQILGVIEKMLKQRRDSLAQYQKANRQDLADQEIYEIDLLTAYLPPQLSLEEINSLIKDALQETKAESIKDFGKVMTVLRPKIQGRADMTQVSDMIKALFKSTS